MGYTHEIETTELIERLTDIIKFQADIIRKQYDMLSQYDAVCELDNDIEKMKIDMEKYI